jgi:hypothetical protein
MIIVPNLLWLTFRYWATRATDVYSMGSSPRRKMVNTCTDFNLSYKTSHIKNINKLLLFIYITSLTPPESSMYAYTIVIPLSLAAVCSM